MFIHLSHNFFEDNYQELIMQYFFSFSIMI